MRRRPKILFVATDLSTGGGATSSGGGGESAGGQPGGGGPDGPTASASTQA